MLKNLKRVMTNDEGATLVEYGLLVALIAVICIAAVGTLGHTVLGAFTGANTAIGAAGAGAPPAGG